VKNEGTGCSTKGECVVNRNASPGLKNTIDKYLAAIKTINGIINLLCLIS